MIDRGQHNLLGVNIRSVDVEAASLYILQAAHEQRPLTVTALAVHGVMTGALDLEQRTRLNHLHMVVPDGQPVRWGVNLLYRVGLPQRVYGPDLMLNVCRLAERQGVSIYLYGNTAETLTAVQARLLKEFPALQIAGMQPSLFRQVTPAEQAATALEIHRSGARIVFVGLGCPRQEVWVYEHQELLTVPSIAVGAAFDFFAGKKAQAPAWMQQRGLEWLFRLTQEPTRLWRRYLLLNPLYMLLFILQWLHLWRPIPTIQTPLPFKGYG